MQLKILAATVLAIAIVGTVHAATPNWVQDFVTVRAPQTKVVRHPTDRGKYYLCWREGTTRYGLAFRRNNFDDKLRLIRPGASVSLANILPLNPGSWTAADEKICWG